MTWLVIERPGVKLYKPLYQTTKRIFDLVFCLVAMPLVLPLGLIIAILIRLGSSGPIFFVQGRIGKGGRRFRMFKFRTMHHHIDRDNHRVFMKAFIKGQASTKDERQVFKPFDKSQITFIGRILRKTSLDELPQLINVLAGDMSLVGPRPDVPEIVAKYSSEMRRVFAVRPGITSIATLHLLDEEKILADVDDPDIFYERVLVPFKVKLAMEHVHRRSFSFHLKILYHTLWMLSFGRVWPLREHPAIVELKKEISENWQLKSDTI